MPLDPIQTTDAIADSYLSYLSTTFHLKDPILRDQFDKALRAPGRFVKGPILEATPPFETASAIESLIRRGVLSPRFRALRSSNLPLDRPLYRHQEQAIRKVVVEGRNVVIATGTGSGKTEAFLVPILHHLFQEEVRGQLGPGVRALLLYPMNALANDQMARLRSLLANYPAITFGRYTGETEGETDKAIEKYRRMFHQEPGPNELVSREQMRQRPPHLLLTNYAMLEYLLLRPDDHVFFDGRYAERWRFLVIDEAHTYAGAKGIEMAMLLRRLKDRVVTGEAGRLVCIATSATLGKGREDFPEVSDFAQQLFGERFEWVEDDQSRQDIIGATRKRVSVESVNQWSSDPLLYVRWRGILRESVDQEPLSLLVQEGKNIGIPETLLQAALQAAGGDCLSFLYQVLKDNAHVAALRRCLEAEPRYLDSIAEELFGDTPHARQQLVALVDLAARARPAEGDQPLLPARYHLFVRSIEGAYTALRPIKQLFLERREQIRVDGQRYAVFEIAECRQCGATYLVGEKQKDGDRTLFRQPGKQSFDHPNNLEFYLLLDETTAQVPDDEDELASYGTGISEQAEEREVLCASCGTIDRVTLVTPLCNCDDSNYFKVIRVPSKEGQVHFCPGCGARSPAGLVWRFLTGNDATASVLATALYQQIPPRRYETRRDVVKQAASVNLWSSTRPARPIPMSRTNTVGQGRQLLVFSDSRQDAAFFAPYLTRTYSRILRRRLIIKTIEDYRERVIKNRWRVQDLVQPLQRQAVEVGLFADMSIQQREGEAWKWVLYELLAIDRRNSLEGLGCLGFSLVRPDRWRPPSPLLTWGLSEDEVWTLFQILLDSFRTKGAVWFPDHVTPEDEFFAPRNREYYFRGNVSNAQRHISSWCPSGKGMTNGRLDFLLRLMRQGLGMDVTQEKARTVLAQIWCRSLELRRPDSCWREFFSAVDLPGEATVYRIKPTFWELRPGTIADIEWYYCDTCSNLTSLNLRGICPTYRCEGRLRPCDPAEEFKDNHYRALYTRTEPLSLVAKEHTAQLTSQAAAELQTEFSEGVVNVLSCSTTFELGVDVGELECVFMRNVPPSAANYIQRAGRAGRRTSSAAFALTFAQRRSHDLAHFGDPKRMVSGEISAPHFRVENEKIVRRHIYATALALFWKEHPQTFGRVEAFFFRDGKNGPELVADYLSRKPTELQVSLERIVPQELQSQLQIDEWGWIDGLLGKEGVLTKAADEVLTDVKDLQRARQRLIRQNRPSDFMLRRINTIKRRYLINHLSSRNVIPKYGFPVDVVELEIWHHADEARRLELNRDLRIALSEYAPSGQVVAGGRLWTSRYLKKVPDRAWPRYAYAVCEYCQRYQRVQADSDRMPETCICGRPLSGRNRGTYIVPEFGFITSLEPPGSPGETRPERTYTTRTYYSGQSREGEGVTLPLGRATLTAVPGSEGQLAVINHAGYQGFKVCNTCGYAVLGHEKVSRPHKTPWRSDCYGTFEPALRLGHEFKTDILQLRFEEYSHEQRGFWLSLLYALLEGACEALDINRWDLDGCLYPYAGDPSMPALVLFDDVPGGAGHVRRIARDGATLLNVLKAAFARLDRCECGGKEGNTSCYGCLRNYRNQFCHDELERGIVMDFLRQLGIH